MTDAVANESPSPETITTIVESLRIAMLAADAAKEHGLAAHVSAALEWAERRLREVSAAT